MKELVGKVAVVTGAGGGIGRAIALSLAAESVSVAVADINAAQAETVATEVRAHGVDAIALSCDVSERASVNRMADAAFGHFGRVDILCNNAGVTSFQAVVDMTDADWDWMMGVDLMSIIYGYQAFVPRMVAQKSGGHIINTSSAMGVVPDLSADHSAYACAKSGAVALAVSLRVELENDDIGVSVLCPQMVRTGILEGRRARPDRFGGADGTVATIPGVDDPLTGAMDPMEVGKCVLDGIRTNRKFIFPHAGLKDLVVRYYEEMLKDFE